MAKLNIQPKAKGDKLTHDELNSIVAAVNDTAQQQTELSRDAIFEVAETGTGNAVTSVTKEGNTVTINKGAKFLTEHQSLADYQKIVDADGKYLGRGETAVNALSLGGTAAEEYATLAFLRQNFATLAKVTADLATKVTILDGYGLSKNDLTDALLAKINSIETGANKYTLKPATRNVIGGVKIGEGLSLTSDGLISVIQGISGHHIEIQGSGDFIQSVTKSADGTTITFVMGNLPTGMASVSYVDSTISSAINALVDGAPQALDTLKEIADALNADEEGSVVNGIMTAIGTKADGSALTAEVTRATKAEKSLSDGKADKATTLSGYGITDAHIKNGVVTLGTATITPVTDISGKVDKVTGKGLSTNDFTDALKKKLDGIAEGANKYTLPKASSTALGGVKIGYTANEKNYPLALDTDGKAYVNVPWTDTTYTGADGISISDKQVITNSGVRSIATGSTNGTISVNTGGTTANVAVKGLGTAAYKAVSYFLAQATFDSIFEIKKKADGTIDYIRAKYGIASDGFISAFGANTNASGTGGVGKGIYSAWENTITNLSDYALGANLGKELKTRLESLENGSATNLTQTGEGNVVTSVTKQGKNITVTKGKALTEEDKEEIEGNSKTYFIKWEYFSSASGLADIEVENFNDELKDEKKFCILMLRKKKKKWSIPARPFLKSSNTYYEYTLEDVKFPIRGKYTEVCFKNIGNSYGYYYKTHRIGDFFYKDRHFDDITRRAYIEIGFAIYMYDEKEPFFYRRVSNIVRARSINGDDWEFLI